jgi:DNA-directed RNA polymerase subunit E'/Rpb7
MIVKELIRDIRIHPSFIGSERLHIHILSELIKQTKDECTKDIGHIVRVLEVKDILDNMIENSSSDIVLKVSFLAEVFKPVIGDIHEGTVIIVFNDGALVNVNDIQKVLVPTAKIKEEVEASQTVNVKLTAIRYNDHVFSCIGETV